MIDVIVHLKEYLLRLLLFLFFGGVLFAIVDFVAGVMESLRGLPRGFVAAAVTPGG